MKTNFYEEKIAEIKKQLINSEYVEAQKSLSAELSMPYIPEKYEKEFIKLFKDLKFQMMDNNSENKTIAIDSLMQMLAGDEESQNIALELLKTHNLRMVSSSIKARLESWEKKDNLKRAYLFELLAEQEIDIDINIDGQILNPKKDSILNNVEVGKAIQMIPILVSKMPQLLEPTVDEFRRYLLLNFPNKINNGEKIATQIFNIVHNLFSGIGVLTEEEEKIKKILNG